MTTSNSNPSLSWLDTAQKLATVTLAIVATLTAISAALFFVVHAAISSDVTPALTQLDYRVSAVEQRLNDMEQRLERLEAGQQQILDALQANAASREPKRLTP